MYHSGYRDFLKQHLIICIHFLVYEQTKKIAQRFSTYLCACTSIFWWKCQKQKTVFSHSLRLFYLRARGCARTKIFDKRKVHKFLTPYISWMFLYHFSSWFYSDENLGIFRAKKKHNGAKRKNSTNTVLFCSCYLKKLRGLTFIIFQQNSLFLLQSCSQYISSIHDHTQILQDTFEKTKKLYLPYWGFETLVQNEINR